MFVPPPNEVTLSTYDFADMRMEGIPAKTLWLQLKGISSTVTSSHLKTNPDRPA